MTSSFDISRTARLSGPVAGLLLAGYLMFAASALILMPSPVQAQTPARIYYSDLLLDARPDPAFADSGGKTRREVLPGVTGPETWVEHFVKGDDVIETLTYNSLIYGIIVKKKDGTNEYWALNDDKKTYALSEGQSPSGWSIKNPPAYGDVIDKVKALIAAQRFDDAVTYITEVTRNAGLETAELYFYRAFCYDQLLEFTYAKPDYRRAISLDPTIADAYFNLGVIYRNEGNPAEAVPLFERYLVLYPTDTRAETIRSYINANK
jgi:tetratricopeptide (TPR) repeat protein